MSEAVGQIIIFAILSMMMILSLIAFGSAQRAVQTKAVDVSASSAAARVAGVVVQTAVLAERLGNGTNTNVTYHIDLPAAIEGRAYTVALQGSSPEQVWVNVTGEDVRQSTGLYAAGQPAAFRVCSGSVPGGPVAVRFDQTTPGKYCIYLVRDP